MPFARNDAVRLYWRLDGEAGKPVLLLLNSIGTDMASWDRALPALLPQFRLLRLDTRGHGASDAPAGEYSMEMLAADALAVMDAAGVETAAVCGISLGGMIAMAMALRAPQRVSALILACTSAAMDRAVWEARIETVRTQGMGAIVDTALQRFFVEDFRRNHPAIVDTFRNMLSGTDAQGYAGCGAAIRDMALLNRLKDIAVPTLIIAGSKDISTPFRDHGASIAAAISGSQVAQLETAHLASVEAPAAFAGAVRKFLNETTNGHRLGDAAQTLYEAGLQTRRLVLGDDWVDRSLAGRTSFNADFQAMITRTAWNEIWSRPGLDHRTRRLLIIAMTAALGRWEEFELHVRAGLELGGFTADELKETLMQIAVYAGVPAANTAFHKAEDILKKLGC